jgi:hypothetical protein
LWLQEEVEVELTTTNQLSFMVVAVVAVAWWNPRLKLSLEQPVMVSVLALVAPAVKTEQTAF